MNLPHSKVNVTAEYDERRTVIAINVAMNYDGISVKDLAATIQALFNPDALLHLSTTTVSHTELGSTDVIQRPTMAARPPIPPIRLNGTVANQPYGAPPQNRQR